MKKLILVRHGKSSWKHDVADHERPLKKRAYKDAGHVLKVFRNCFEKPVMIWSSKAVRAFETAKLFKKELDIADENFIKKEELYTFDRDELKTVISECDDKVDQLMIFGHNPAITELVNKLGDEYFDNIPTTGLVMLSFETDSWKKLNNGKILLHLFPKELR